jgi:phenylacetic acid degradation operon negative regulatory protein
MKIDFSEVLDLFCWGMDKLTKPTLRNLLAGYEEYQHRRDPAPLMTRLTQQRLLEQRGRGRQAMFTITAKGWERVGKARPEASWNRSWDGLWRVVTFDVPEVRRKDRVVLWKALRSRKLGLLQRSVWIWPHNIEPILQEIVRAEGIPECFCGFEARRLFLCTNAELVRAAWDFEEISARQGSYLKRPMSDAAALIDVKSLGDLAAHGRAERLAYEHAFSLDPMLPKALWPPGYRGAKVEARHQTFRRALGARLRNLTNLRNDRS